MSESTAPISGTCIFVYSMIELDLRPNTQGRNASARARLEFFYQRSPYSDNQMNLYPVGRIITPLNQ
ncbi:MAG TPA: hypothetical protein VF899_00550 [Pyrinomonadaceae bacterium]